MIGVCIMLWVGVAPRVSLGDSGFRGCRVKGYAGTIFRQRRRGLDLPLGLREDSKET
jgi:hypothetical protein